MRIYFLFFLVFIGIIHTNAQNIYEVVEDSAIVLNFEELKTPPHKVDYKKYVTDVNIKKIPKKLPYTLMPEPKPVSLIKHTVLVSEIAERQKIAVNFKAKPIGATDIIDAPDFVFKDISTLNLKHLEKAHGFFSNSISAVQQDKNGIIWLASETDGLCKYDGDKMRIYSIKSGLPSNRINSIYYDSKENLWLSTEDGVCYIKGGEIFLPDSNVFLNSQTLFVDEDRNLDLWIGSKKMGIFKLSNNSIEIFDRLNGLPNNWVNAVLLDSDDNYWFGIDNGGICKFDGKVFEHYYSISTNIKSSCKSIYENEQGIWFGMFGGPILNFNNNSFYEYHFIPGKNHTVSSFLENRNGMWIADYGFGIINIKNNRVTTITPLNGLNSKSALRIYSDNKNNIWIATLFGGVSRLDENIFSANDSELDIPLKITEGIIKDENSNIWYLPNGGEIVKEDSLFYTTYNNDGNKQVPPLHHTFDAEILDDGSVLFATYSTGICKLNNEKFTYYQFEKGNFVLDISKSNDKDIWFSTMSNGLIKYDMENFYFLTKEDGLSSDNISAIFHDNQNQLWVATNNIGVNVIQNNQIAYLTKETGLASNIINCFYQDNHNRIWIGTENGINIIAKDKTQTINRQTGLISNKIRSIIQDNDSNYWIATADGLSKVKFISDRKIEIKNYGNHYGLNVTDFNSSVLYLDSGEIIWGTNNEILTFKPDNKETDSHPIILNLCDECLIDTIMQGVKISDKFISIKSDSKFELNFTAIDWGHETEINYHYSIISDEGDTAWIDLGTQNNLVLQDIQYGKYKLLVKAVGENGNSDIKSIDFEVLPYWWQTNFVRILLIIIFLLLGPLVFYISVKRAKQIQSKLERKVSEKTKELVKENKIKDALIQEVHHRVKNNLMSISILVDMQMKNLKTIAEKQALIDTQLRIGAMALVHEMLYTSDDVTLVSVKKYIEELVATINEMTNTSKLPIVFEISSEDIMLSVNDCISFGLITSEVISNAIKYAFKNVSEPKISISLIEENDKLVYSIKDNGLGFDMKEMENKPTLGMQLIDIFTRQLESELNIENDNGTVVRITIPKKTFTKN